MSPQSRPCLEPANSPMPLWFPLHRCLSRLAPPSGFFLESILPATCLFPFLACNFSSFLPIFLPLLLNQLFLAGGKEIWSFSFQPPILGNFLFHVPTRDIPEKLSRNLPSSLLLKWSLLLLVVILEVCFWWCSPWSSGVICFVVHHFVVFFFLFLTQVWNHAHC